MTGLEADTSDSSDAVMYSSSSSSNASSTSSNESKDNNSNSSNYDSTSSSGNTTQQEERNPFVPYYLRKDLKYQRTKTKKRQQKTNKARPVVQLMMQKHRQHQQQKNIASALSDTSEGEVQAEMLVGGTNRMPSPDAILRGDSSPNTNRNISKKHGSMPRHHHHHHHHHYHHHHTSKIKSSDDPKDHQHNINAEYQKQPTTASSKPSSPQLSSSPGDLNKINSNIANKVKPNIMSNTTNTTNTTPGSIDDTHFNSPFIKEGTKTSIQSKPGLPSISELMERPLTSSTSKTHNVNNDSNEARVKNIPNEPSLSFFREAFMCLPTAAVIQSLHGEFISVNTTFMQLTGYNEEELIGAHSQDIMHPDDVFLFEGRLKSILNGEYSQFSILSRFLHRQGGEIPTVIKGVVKGYDEYPESLLLCSVIDIDPTAPELKSHSIRSNLKKPMSHAGQTIDREI